MPNGPRTVPFATLHERMHAEPALPMSGGAARAHMMRARTHGFSRDRRHASMYKRHTRTQIHACTHTHTRTHTQLRHLHLPLTGWKYGAVPRAGPHEHIKCAGYVMCYATHQLAERAGAGESAPDLGDALGGSSAGVAPMCSAPRG